MRDTFRKADLHVHSSFSFDVPDLAALHPRALFEAAGPPAGLPADATVVTAATVLAGQCVRL